MRKCTDTKIGDLITFYEMNLLTKNDSARFEEHAIDCEYCMTELKNAKSRLSILHQQKQKILAELHKQGINYKSEKEELLANIPGKLTHNVFQFEGIIELLRQIIYGRELIPALVVTSILLMILILPPSTVPENPYLPYLTFEKALHIPLDDSRAVQSESFQFFSKGMSLYQNDQYHQAIEHLQMAAENDPDEGIFWLYLGICQYLDRQVEDAVETLYKARNLVDPVKKNTANWYLSQTYLLEGEASSAVPLLISLIDQDLEYAEESAALLENIRLTSPELFED